MCSHFEFFIIHSLNFLYEKCLSDFVFNISGSIFQIYHFSFPVDYGKRNKKKETRERNCMSEK